MGHLLGKTWLTGTYMYYKTMQAPDIDYSSAIAFFIVILGVILSKVVTKFSRNGTIDPEAGTKRKKSY